MKSKMAGVASKFLAAIAVTVLLSGSIGGAVGSVRAAGDITRVSVDSVGTEANNASKRPSISGDGRFVAFESDASNLVANDTNASTDIFVKDRQTGEVTRVSVDSGGQQANGGSGGTAISADGRFVAFVSDASNLVANDTNGTTDVFVRDRQLGTTVRVSVSSSGEQANDFSDFPLAISSDGRFVAFNSDATNLVLNDTNVATDVFVHDNQTGATERVSIGSDGTQANDASYYPSISANGQLVTFTSNGSTLVAGDSNNKSDVFVRDRVSSTTMRVSVNSSGAEADEASRSSAVSGDGRYVVFLSKAGNFAPGTDDFSGKDFVYLHDRLTGQTTLISVYSDEAIMTAGLLDQPAISGDGHYAAFSFYDKGDNNGIMNIWIRDLQAGISTLVKNGNDSSFGSSLSANGNIIAFWSGASNLVAGDANGAADIFTYQIQAPPDLTPPTVVSSDPTCGTSCSFPTPASVSFRVVFSEPVTGVEVDDFMLAFGSEISGAYIDVVSGSGSEYLVTANSGTSDGVLRLDIFDNDTILDAALNPLGGAGSGNGNFTAGSQYLVDKNPPMTASITRLDANPTAANQVRFTVNFSEPVTGVDTGDFAIASAGSISGAVLTEVSGSAASYTVTVNAGTGDGTIRLDLLDNDSIVDRANTPLGGSGIGNGNFTTGEEYTVNRTVPVVVSILRADPNPATGLSVRFTVAFSKAVSGVDASDFAVATTGNIVGANIKEASGVGNLYTVTLGTGTGSGTIRLNLVDNDSIVDGSSLPLGGPGAGNGNFNLGEEYSVNKPSVTIRTEIFGSNGTNDGWVLETSENSNQGGARNATDTTFRLGDDAQDRQYRAILHFPTYYLPDNAVITEVILLIRRQGVVGTDPFTTHSGVSIDLRTGVFGNLGPFGIKALQGSDFQNPASLNSAGTISNNPIGDWYVVTLNSAANPYVNLTGMTQLRLAFQLDDNDDLSDDYLTFYSGNDSAYSNRPQLAIKYYIP
ncbi:MAG: PD40 domain-containing protein [Anaerolineales bacterium]|nr:PD40 domain-containing protein [Anaerolineales bacterium]